MGINASKLKCLYLPAQSGKTRKMEELIKYYKDISECFADGDVNIIISANNILLVKQTEARMTNDLATESEEGANDAVIKTGVFSWTSGEKECNISPTDLAFRMLGEVEMVVMCANAVRLNYLALMLTRLTACPLFTKKINIWIDEADKSVKLWSKHSALLSLPAINQVTLVSATFDSVFSKYGSLQVLGFYKTHPDCYRRLKDAIKIEENFATEDAADYVRQVMLKNRDKLVRPGLRAFIPGEMRKASHDAIAEFLHKELGFVVIIINGERKEILVPGETPIDLRRYLTVSNGELPEELNVQLAKLYTTNNWARFPLAITGFYCVERGVTFQCGPQEGVHDGFLLTTGCSRPSSTRQRLTKPWPVSSATWAISPATSLWRSTRALLCSVGWRSRRRSRSTLPAWYRSRALLLCQRRTSRPQRTLTQRPAGSSTTTSSQHSRHPGTLSTISVPNMASRGTVESP